MLRNKIDSRFYLITLKPSEPPVTFFSYYFYPSRITSKSKDKKTNQLNPFLANGPTL